MKLTLKEVYLNEIERKNSIQYYKDIKMKNPELFGSLTNFANALIRFHRRDLAPKKLLDPFSVYLQRHDNMDPNNSPNIVGVKMFIDSLARDRDEARVVKKYLDSLFNALLKNRYEKSKKTTIDNEEDSLASIKNKDKNKKEG